MKDYLKPIWRFLVGGALVAYAGYLLVPALEETTFTVAVLVGIALVAVGATVLADVF